MGNYILITNYNNIDDLNKAVDNCIDIISKSDYKLNEDIKIITVSNYGYENKNSFHHIISDGNHYIAGLEFIKNYDNNPIVMFLDSDDVILDGKLEIFKEDFNKYGYISNYLKQSNNGKLIKFHDGIIFSGSTINAKYYNLNFLNKFGINGSDYIFYLYTIENGIKIKQIEKCFNIYTVNPNSITHRDPVQFNRNIIKILNYPLTQFKNKKVTKKIKKRILEMELRVKYDTHAKLTIVDIIKYTKVYNLNLREDIISTVKMVILLLPYKYRIKLYPLSKFRRVKN